MAETMGPPDKQQQQQHPQQQHPQQHHKKRFKKWKHFRDREQGGEGQQHHPQQGQQRGFRRPVNLQMPQNEVVTFDFNVFPADLDEAALAALQESLPPAAKKKQKPAEHGELQQKNLADLFEVAEEEGVEIQNARTRRDVIFEITTQRLRSHVAVLVEGVVALQGPHQMLRSSCYDYMPAQDDVVIPPSVVQRYALLPGMTVRGRLRAPREGEKHFAVVDVDQIDCHVPEEARTRAPFKELTPLYPEQRIILEGVGDNPLEMRIVDLITPVGRGQRGLIVAPPRTGKTILLQMLAKSILQNAPDAHLIVLLVDERPEEVTDFERMLPEGKREIVSSTFDEPAARHLQVAEMVMLRAKSLVEAGEDVVILLDSITRLARASNIEAPSNGKLLSGGMDATALQFPKRFFGAARNIENGGSLTILGTALIETGSKMDELIFEEFKGTGNMELVLDRRLSDRRIFPAIDINRSGTRKEELLFTPEEIKRIWMLRKLLNEMDPVEAMEILISKMKKTRVNAEFLMSIG
jgi:transcription termination factor Rho